MPRDYPLMGERAHVAEIAERSHVGVRLGAERLASSIALLGMAGVSMRRVVADAAEQDRRLRDGAALAEATPPFTYGGGRK